jgi:hypothetical protein
MKRIAIITSAIYLSGCAAVQQRQYDCQKVAAAQYDYCLKENERIAAENQQAANNATAGNVLLGVGALLLIGAAAANASRPTTHHSNTTCTHSRYSSSCSSWSNY